MTSAFPKLLTAGAAAAFLAVSPVSAQPSGGPQVVPHQDLDARVSPYKHELREGFLGAQIPPRVANLEGFAPQVGQYVPRNIYTLPVSEAMVAERPDLAGYEYFVLPDDRVVLVDPTTGAVASIID